MTTKADRPSLLTRRFYQRDALEVARELLGMQIHRGNVILRITEVEAYRGVRDSACHARSGRTARNETLWGPPGRSYVYLCYGLHLLLNFVTAADGDPHAVLIRGCEPLSGSTEIAKRRNGIRGPRQLDGPGKVGAALGLTLAQDGQVLFRKGDLEVRRGTPPDRIAAGPRIGIDYATPPDRNAPWRLADADSRYVGHRAKLTWKGD